MAWFHARSRSEGTGYSVASAAGLVASVVFIVTEVAVFILCVISVTKYSVMPLYALLVGLGIEGVVLFLFLALVRAKSDKTDGGL